MQLRKLLTLLTNLMQTPAIPTQPPTHIAIEDRLSVAAVETKCVVRGAGCAAVVGGALFEDGEVVEVGEVGEGQGVC